MVVKSGAVEAYFPVSADATALKEAVRKFVRDVVKLHRRKSKAVVRWRIVRDENWQNDWKRFIKPRRVGKLFWVTPPWLTAPKFRRRQAITIEPGLAFGTGTHATTRGCMEFLEQAADLLRGRGFTALDVGTGAGILAIALVKLGAKSVWAIDNDPVALQVARENLTNNSAADKVHLSDTPLNRIKKRFTLIVANLTAETIFDLTAALERRVSAHGFLILSGILQRKADALLRRFRANFRVIRQKRGREWATLLLQRK